MTIVGFANPNGSGKDNWALDLDEQYNRHVDKENEWLWDLRERLLSEVKQIEQRITAITGITDFRR